MKLFGYEFLKSSEVTDLRKSLSRVQENTRPSLDLYEGYGYDSVRLPFLPYGYRVLYDIVRASDILRNVIGSLKGEMFRNGFEFEPKWKNKCLQCGREFEFETTECDNCGFKQFDSPNFLIADGLDEKFKCVNENNQSLLEVLEQFEDDLNITDDGYLLFVKDYTLNSTGKIVAGQIQELLRVNPGRIRMLTDKEGRPGRNLSGEKVFTCPKHRDTLIVGDKETHCKQCGGMLYRTYYFAFRGEGEGENRIYYIDDEVIHVSKYMPSLTYGYSPVYAVWQKTIALLEQDKYIKDSYFLQRAPKGLLLVNTSNQNALFKAWDWLLDKLDPKRGVNPNMVYPLGIESNSQRGNVAQYINFMQSLQEMQYTESRNEFRRSIGAIYGVMPLFQADTSTSGGLNNEGLQITVTNRAVEKGQKIYNEKVLPEILRQYGVTEFELILLPSEEKDEMAELQREQLKIQNAQIMHSMGFEIELDEEGEFVFSGEAKDLTQNLGQVPFGQEPGFGEQNFQGAPEDVTNSITKGKVFLKPGEEPPKGKKVQTGPKGGKFYESGPSGDDVKVPTEQPASAATANVESVRQFYSAPKTEQWVQSANEWHQKTPKDEPVFVYGRHVTENDLTEDLRDYMKNALKTKIFQIPTEFMRPGGAGKVDRKKYDTFLSKLFDGRQVVDIHSAPSFQSGFVDFKRSPNLTAIEFPARNSGSTSQFAISTIVDQIRRGTFKPKPRSEFFKAEQNEEIASEVNEVENTLDKELEEFVRKLSLKRKPSEKQLKETVKKLAERMAGDLKKKSIKDLERVYKSAMKEVEKELKVGVSFGKKDQNALDVLSKSKVFVDSYDGMSDSVSKKLNDVITEAYNQPELFSLNKLTEKMKEISKDESFRLERIARTETQHINNVARKNSYLQADKKGDFKYKWLTVNDSRRTEVCKAISDRSKQGVSLVELKKIISEEAKRFGHKPRDFTPHINCRSTLIKVV